MLLQIILFIALGIFAGTITGLIPGIHINLIGVFLISISSSLLFLNKTYLITFIVSMAITHTFLDFIPSIFLGCPDTDTELSILPGHQMLKMGLGYEAIALTTYGSLAAIILLMFIAFPSIKFLPIIYNFIKGSIPLLLILVSSTLILSEKHKFQALFIFSLTGALGLFVFNLEIKEPLLPLLTGLFGTSMLLLSIRNKTQIPIQKDFTKEKIVPTIPTKPLFGALIASPICSFLPGLGSGQAALIGNSISKTNPKEFLILLGTTNTLVMGFSFISLYAIGKTRTGAAVAVQQIINTISNSTIILILITILISGIISFYLTLFIARIFSKNIDKINYTKVSLITITIVTLVVLLVSNFIGVFILITSTLTGIYAMSFNVRKTNMMGCLMLPIILFYLL